jgi:hypothetical protein
VEPPAKFEDNSANPQNFSSIPYKKAPNQDQVGSIGTLPMLIWYPLLNIPADPGVGYVLTRFIAV